MTSKVGGGRPWGPIRAENPAARRLAEALRRHVDDSGKTLAVLSGEISMSKAQTGVYLAGKVPTETFIVALIRATVRPDLRGRRQEEALALREQAMRPAPRTAPSAPVVAGPGGGYAVELAAAQARQIETYDRLTRTLEQRAEVERAKNNSDKLVMVLLNMIHQLDRRVAGLVEERDQLLAQPRSEALEDAERKLARAEEQEQRARAELRRAEEKQRQAETLEARVTDQLRRLTDELDRLRADDTTSPLDTLPALADEPQEHHASADPVGDDIDAALAHASAVNDEDNTTLNRVTSQLNEPAAGVVQDNTPDNPTSSASLNAPRHNAMSGSEVDDPKRTIDLFNTLIPGHNRTVGPDHFDTFHAFETARNLYQRTGNTNGEADAWNNLGTALKELRRFDEALHAFETTRDLYQRTGNTNGEADAWNNLGTALKELRRFDEALHAFETTRDLYQRTGNTNGEADAWNNLGTALKELRRFDEALHAFETTRDLYQRTGNTNGEADAWNNLGTALKELRRFDEALHAFETARDLYQ
ncbi:tetratricopeptide repeat protein (plasmid) [Streptomyces sp. NBC_01218]|uniref:tetratricopeptide repeat protein n=1 Tax=Streptomyces sp. NBC_01218 TaxID=2903780 RepID=UPI002E12F3A7|nr:tetratricopeptide repeat protein [Streptomyces sp. NBC_01218]